MARLPFHKTGFFYRTVDAANVKPNNYFDHQQSDFYSTMKYLHYIVLIICIISGGLIYKAFVCLRIWILERTWSMYANVARTRSTYYLVH